jgi:hypothetical protein
MRKCAATVLSYVASAVSFGYVAWRIVEIESTRNIETFSGFIAGTVSLLVAAVFWNSCVWGIF